LLRQAIALQPNHHGARFHLVQVKKVKPGDENLAALEALVPGLSALDQDKRIALHYALRKAYDDLGDYDRSFPHFLAGARLKRTKLHYHATAEATYDLAELGQHYTHYARLMDHWRQVLPPGAFLEVQYEDIVADMEGQARRIITYCELEWDEAYLGFHRKPRSIRTASVTQVRQPIYTSSVERWRHYEAYLGPMLAAAS